MKKEFGPNNIEQEHFISRCALVKIGSTTITEGATNENPLNTTLIDDIARQCSYLYKNGVKIIVVSSGAVACGLNLLSTEKHNTQNRQVAATFGQPILMNAWIAAFKKNDILAGQILVTEDDLKKSREVLQESLKVGVPIINANDSVNIKEIEKLLISADNDRLSGFIAKAVGVDTALILTDVKGVLDSNNSLIEDSSLINDSICFHKNSDKGTGGMESKVRVLKDLSSNGITGFITDTKREDFILEILRGNTKDACTIFKAN